MKIDGRSKPPLAERQLDARREGSRPPPADNLVPWLGWVSTDDLLWLEDVMRSAVLDGRALGAADQLRVISIEVDATRRMIPGEPRP